MAQQLLGERGADFLKTNRTYQFIFMSTDRLENLIVKLLQQAFAIFNKFEVRCKDVSVVPQDTEEAKKFNVITVFIGGELRNFDIGFSRVGTNSIEIQEFPNDPESIKEYRREEGEWVFPLSFKVEGLSKSDCVRMADFLLIMLMGPLHKRLHSVGLIIPFNSVSVSLPTVQKRQGPHGLWTSLVNVVNVRMAWNQLFLKEGDFLEEVNFLFETKTE